MKDEEVWLLAALLRTKNSVGIAVEEADNLLQEYRKRFPEEKKECDTQ